MSVQILRGYDVTHAFINDLPADAKIVAGYTTGSSGIPWDAADWARYPDAIRIDQDPAATDHTADVLDIERGAATFADAPGWYKATLINWQRNKRPGQLLPCIYASLSNIPNVVNALIAGGVTKGPRLWVAHWDLAQSVAASDVTEIGPFPIVAYQFNPPGTPTTYDVDVFASDWLASDSAANPLPLPDPDEIVSVSVALHYESGRILVSNPGAVTS